METPLAIANYFIKKSQDTGVELSPMKLVKLIYLSHAWYLAITNEPLLPESVEAWKYGPVVPSIYHLFKKYGNEQITQMEMDYACMTYPEVTNKEVISLLDAIWELYALNYSGLQLSTLTHEKDSPWYTTWHEKGGSNKKAVIIPNDLIKEYYRNKIKSTQSVATDGNPQ